MAHSTFLCMPKRNNLDIGEACAQKERNRQRGKRRYQQELKKSFWLQILIFSEKNQMEFLLIDPLEKMTLNFWWICHTKTSEFEKLTITAT